MIAFFMPNRLPLAQNMMMLTMTEMKMRAIGLEFSAGLEISEFSLESLLRPPFLRSFSRIIFDLIKQETTLVN